MDNSKTWLEVCVNGGRSREDQPNIPMSSDEIVSESLACVEAGAGVVCVAAYDQTTGKVTLEPDMYSKIIEGIRTKVDAIVYPFSIKQQYRQVSTEEKEDPHLKLIEVLGERGHLEWLSVTPGSHNITSYSDIRSDIKGDVNINTEAEIRTTLGLAKKFKVHPSYQIVGPSSIRLGASLNWREDSPMSVYRFVFSSGFPLGFPPEDYGLTAYLNLLDQVAPGAPWMVSGLDADIASMIPRAVLEGGHIRVGLGDIPHNTDQKNIDIVKKAAEDIEGCGGALATGEDIRNSLGGIRKNPELMQN